MRDVNRILEDGWQEDRKSLTQHRKKLKSKAAERKA